MQVSTLRHNSQTQEVGSRIQDYDTTTLRILTNTEIDVVSIASYDNFHCEQIVLALEHSKHVFVEKPLP